MNPRKFAFLLNGAILALYTTGLLLFLTGCASKPVISHQIVTPAMTMVPPRPSPPDPETADQREVALYIVQLRGWGNGLALRLKAISDLISQEPQNGK